MGAWDAGPFGNDGASDLLASLDEVDAGQGVDLLREVLTNAADIDGYLDVDGGQMAVAAAALVAAQRRGGRPPDLAPEAMPEWLEAGVDLPDDLAPLALRAVDRVLGDESELRDLWSDGGDLGEFGAGLARLRMALAADRQGGAEPAAKPARKKRRKRQRFEPGVIVRVDLGDGSHTYARMLSERPYMAVYDHCMSNGDADMDLIIRSPVLFVLAVSDYAYTSGRWPRVGSVRLEMGDVTIPDFFMQDLGDPRKCELYRSGRSRGVSPEECVGLERAAVWGPEHIESRILDHYENRPNAYAESLKLRPWREM